MAPSTFPASLHTAWLSGGGLSAHVLKRGRVARLQAARGEEAGGGGSGSQSEQLHCSISRESMASDSWEEGRRWEGPAACPVPAVAQPLRAVQLPRVASAPEPSRADLPWLRSGLVRLEVSAEHGSTGPFPVMAEL